MQAYDVIVIGAGPAGIFTALELDKLMPQMRVLVVDFRLHHRQPVLSCQNLQPLRPLQDLPHHERLGRRRRVFLTASFLFLRR